MGRGQTSANQIGIGIRLGTLVVYSGEVCDWIWISHTAPVANGGWHSAKAVPYRSVLCLGSPPLPLSAPGICVSDGSMSHRDALLPTVVVNRVHYVAGVWKQGLDRRTCSDGKCGQFEDF